MPERPKGTSWNFTTKQKDVIGLGLKEQRMLVDGGVRCGKSTAIAYLVDFICSHTPDMVFFIFRKNYEGIKTDTQLIFKQKPGWLTPNKGIWKDGGKQFNYYNGSIIYFRHAQDTDNLPGITMGGAWFEEVTRIKEEVFDYVNSTRLTQWSEDSVKKYLEKKTPSGESYSDLVKQNKLLLPKNYMFMSTNPEAGWVKERFVNENPVLKENVYRRTLTTWDNFDNLPASFKEQMDFASDEFKRIYYEGSWEFSEGRVYPEFKTDRHIISVDFDDNLDFSNLRVVIALDPALNRSKFGVLFTAILPNGKTYWFDELAFNGRRIEEIRWKSVPEIVAAIKDKVKKYNLINPTYLIDTSANAKEITSLESLSSQLKRMGIPVQNAKKTLERDTIFAIKSGFKNEKILVSERCEYTIKELSLFRWGKNEKPIDEDNDLLDCARFCWNHHAAPKDTYQMQLARAKEMYKNTWDSKTVYKNWLKEIGFIK